MESCSGHLQRGSLRHLEALLVVPRRTGLARLELVTLLERAVAPLLERAVAAAASPAVRVE